MRVIAGILVALALVGIGVGIGASADGDWGPRHDAVVVSGGSGATDAGQTIVVADGHYGHGFFFFPFGLLFFALFLFLVFGLFRRGRGGPVEGIGRRVAVARRLAQASPRRRLRPDEQRAFLRRALPECRPAGTVDVDRWRRSSSWRTSRASPGSSTTTSSGRGSPSCGRRGGRGARRGTIERAALSSSSISGCPIATASTSSATCVTRSTSRSSSSPRGATRPTGSSGSSSARTTTSSSRSARRSSWHVFGRCSAAPRRGRRPARSWRRSTS